MGSLVGGLLVIYSCQKAPPPLVAVVRSSEILLAVFADYVIFQTSSPDALHLFGSGVTLVSVALMAASDWIQDAINKHFLMCCKDNPTTVAMQEQKIIDEPLLMNKEKEEKYSSQV